MNIPMYILSFGKRLPVMTLGRFVGSLMGTRATLPPGDTPSCFNSVLPLIARVSIFSSRLIETWRPILCVLVFRKNNAVCKRKTSLSAFVN